MTSRTTAPILALATAALLASTAQSLAFDENTLVIWTGEHRDHEAFQAIADQFEADLGIKVVIEEHEPLPDKFQQAAAVGDGPDIVMYAHDRFGEWAAGGLIAPVDPSADKMGEQIDTAWDAVSFANKVWGYPIAVEAIGLVYNTALIDTPPASFEEIASLDLPEGVAPILWDYNNTYFTMPLLMANGGYAFKKVDGAYDGTTTGVANEGAMMGAKVLKGLIDDGTMPTGVDYGVMDGAMAKGEVAMIINGPWSWAGYEAAGIDIAVAPLPMVDGKQTPPFLGVMAMAINAASPNKDLAVELIENYITTDEGLSTWNANGALGALTDITAGAELDDPKIAATLANAAYGVPMPSNPEMGKFWAAMQPALTNITTGAATVEDALNDAETRILAE
ncbi:maltose/maltodextrin ABC transporter substrate-binding protein MalE [Cucumibacter marinus]|uniref:maltose/maltodextrin ABC transporter substrate-binding protein MalE n=1 Tax=Cucumibacter marinus TaxID=1121252 RepID=UPI000427FECB|nr:maltose/maltodextrin ABC transporter substrate-binding protein MalE [Cucumibacter marinus]